MTSNITTVGVDVGGTSTRVGMVDADGHVGVVAASATPRGAEAVTRHLVAEIGAVIDRSGTEPGAIAIGIPGRVDPSTGTVALAVNLGIEEPLLLGPAVAAALGRPVVVGNDVDVAAVGAHEQLGGGTESLVYFNIGTGFAAGLVLDGRLHRGVGGAGEIGHLPVPGGRQRCRCGQIGCAETLASGRSMLRAWGHPESDLEELWNAADDGEDLAVTIRDAALDTIAWLAQCTVMMLDVERIVIGGGVSRLGTRLLDPLLTRLLRQADASPLLPTYALTDRVRLADPDVEYGVRGAAVIARESI
ncbi:MAG: ROK family protein [Ilumatobacteraceae bacterium]